MTPIRILRRLRPTLAATPLRPAPLASSLRPALFALLAAVSASAGAAFPESLAGTTWRVVAARDQSTLVIESQAAAGAPGSENCHKINGALNDLAPIEGYYCPGTGQFQFLHRNADSGSTVRVFTGNVSEAAEIDAPLFIGGTVSIHAQAFGPLGEHNFSAIGK